MNPPAQHSSERPDNTPVYVRWGSVVVMVVLLFLFLAFLPPRFQSTTIKANIKGQEIEINTKALSTTPEKAAAEFDARTDYVDSSRGFAFKRPSNSRWSDPKILHGLVELLAEKKVATSPVR